MPRSRISFTGHSAYEEPTVNLTPLIDVVFVILIVFIVIAPLLELDHVELAKSGAATHEAVSLHESSPITIHVHKDNSIWLDKKKISIGELSNVFREYRLKYPQASPQIFHDKEALFGTYQAVKNAAEEAGFTHIDIILKPA